MKRRRTARSGEGCFKKVGERKKFASKFRKVRERCPPPTIAAVLSIYNFSNFALHLIDK